MTWADAVRYCQDLTLDGRDDWRLPSIGELRSLVRGCPATETGGSCNVQDDGCLAWDCRDPSCGCSGEDVPAWGCYWPEEVLGACLWYWSASSRTDNHNHAWIVSFPGAGVNRAAKAGGDGLVRCVRGGNAAEGDMRGGE